MSSDYGSATILVADDEDRFRDALVDALDFFGYRVKAARTGAELREQAAVLMAEGGRYLLIVDNQMPERTGETERQWCGFHRVLDICRERPNDNLGAHVLFLSRWGIQDLGSDDRNEAVRFGLLNEEQWLPVHIPFAKLKGLVISLLNKQIHHA